MSYLVLARKYRPQTFSEVVGQDHVTRTLSNAFAQDRVHHAFLFCGPRGVGKTTLARILSKALNCDNGPTAEPCGECDACVSITNGTAVDYFEMDGASNRGIDSIRDLTDAVRYQPAVLRKKVYVIDEVHMLTTEAFNALLKTLEEPPPHVTFVMATTEPHKLPNTILSRCQRYDFKLVPRARLSAHLESVLTAEQIQAEAGALGLIVRESGGSVRDAMSLCDQVISYVGAEPITEATVAEVLGVADRALTRTLVRSLAESRAGDALEAVEAAVERGVDEVQLARAVVRYLRDLAATHVAPNSDRLIDGTSEELAELREEASRIEPAHVRQMFERMMRACDDMGMTQQPRLVLDLALIETAALEPLLPLGDLIDRLAALERGLGPGGRAGGAKSADQGGRRPPPQAAAARAAAPQAAPQAAPASSSSPKPPRRFESAVPPADLIGPPTDGLPPAAPQAAPASSQRAAASKSKSAPVASKSKSAPVASKSKSAPATRPAAAPAASKPAAASSRRPAPAPAPASAARTQPLATPPSGDREQAMLEWERVVTKLGETPKLLPLVRVYENGKVLAWEGDELIIGYPEDHLDADLACDPGKVAAMTKVLAERYGPAIVLKVKLLTAAELAAAGTAQSLLEREEQRVASTRNEREEEARAHPMTKMVLETFEASIKEVKTDV